MERSRRNFSRKFSENCLSSKKSSLSCGFRLCLTVLKHKGQQVEKQREEIEMLGKKKVQGVEKSCQGHLLTS